MDRLLNQVCSQTVFRTSGNRISALLLGLILGAFMVPSLHASVVITNTEPTVTTTIVTRDPCTEGLDDGFGVTVEYVYVGEVQTDWVRADVTSNDAPEETGGVSLTFWAETDGRSRRRFLVSSDGRILDTLSGLMWQTCPQGMEGESCELGEADTMDWQAALIDAQSDEFAGHSDWRLPNVRELQSITPFLIESGKGQNGPFVNPPGTDFWTSSPAAYEDNSWAVDFKYGCTRQLPRTDKRAVRLVRDSPEGITVGGPEGITIGGPEGTTIGGIPIGSAE